MDDVIRTCLKLKRGAFIDVGANIGQTLLKVLRLDKDRRYVGFEPQPYGAFLIDDFISRNLSANRTILPIALSDKTAIVRLGITKANDVAASFIDEYRPEGFYSSYKHIVTMTGDDCLSRLDVESVAIIKIDVEGAELEVIRGLSNTITTHKPYVLFEVLPHFLLKTARELDEETKATRDRRHSAIERELRLGGYSFFQVRADGVEEVHTIRADPRRKFDYLAIPQPDVPAFLNVHNNARIRTPAVAT